MNFHFRRALIITLVAGIGKLFGQEQDKKQSAEMMDLAREMRKASVALDDIRDIVVQAADMDTTNLDANYEAGILHLNTIKKDQSVKYLLRVQRQFPEYKFDLGYYIGRGYQFGFRFSKALEYFEAYRTKYKSNPRYRGTQRASLREVERNISECKNGLEFMSKPGEYKVENLGPGVNSEWNDYAPALNLNEDFLIFTSRRSDGNMNENVSSDDNRPFEDIYFSTKKDEKWSPAVNIGEPVNTPFNDSNIALSPDGKSLYTYHDGDIFIAQMRPDGKWGEPQMMPEPINSDSVEYSISVTSDGKTVYFSSDREGGYGGFDIYSATKGPDGKWGNVRNLGSAINTEYDEDSPFIDYTGNLLYFSSMGKKGMGGFDIFRSGLLDAKKNTWSEPENLGYPINTPDNDIYFVGSKESKTGYYASVREGGLGYLDIYKISLPVFVPKQPALLPLNLIVTIQDTDSGEDLKGYFSLQNTTDNSIAADPVDKNGETVFYVRSPDRQSYILTATRDGYESATETITLDGASATEVTVRKTIRIKKARIPLKLLIKLVDAETQKQIDGKVILTSPAGQQTGNSLFRNGYYQFDVNSDGKEYRVAIEKAGYLFTNQPIYLDIESAQNGIIEKVVSLSKLKPGSVGTLNNIYFDFASSIIKEQSFTELKQLEKILKDNPGMHIEVTGHTDNIGSTAFNQRLSELRAAAVKTYFAANGISADRITTQGFGETMPLVSNDDEREGRQFNRRVEFRIIK